MLNPVSFATADADAKLRLKPVVDLAKKVLPVVCPNPNITISALPPKISLGCR
jgi:hypothetical protein